jgi:hypothetical protein
VAGSRAVPKRLLGLILHDTARHAIVTVAPILERCSPP